MTGMATTGNGQMVKRSDSISGIKQILEKHRVQIARGLTRHLTFERLIALTGPVLDKTPALLGCTQASLLGAIVAASQLGLEFDGRLGHAYIVPYKTEATLIIGYRGMMKLARRSGEVGDIEAHVVYEGDDFQWSLGIKKTLDHRPAVRVPLDDRGAPDASKISHAYAIAYLKGGNPDRPMFEVMCRPEIDAIRRRSRASASGPWVTDYAEMAKKTVLRRLLKQIPMSVEDNRAERLIQADEAADANLDQGNAAIWQEAIEVQATPVQAQPTEAPKAQPEADEPGSGPSGDPDAR